MCGVLEEGIPASEFGMFLRSVDCFASGAVVRARLE